MSPVALVLVLVAAVVHAWWNFYAKRAGAAGPLFVWLYAVCSAALYLPIAVGLIVVEGIAVGWTMIGAMAASAVLHVAYFLLLQRGYATGDLSVVYPLARGTGPLLSVLAAVLLFGERPGVLGLLGAALVIAGVVVIGTATGAGGSIRSSGVLFGVLTGVAIAGYTLWDAHAVTTLAVAPLLLNWGSSVGEALLLTPYAVARRSQLAGLWRAHRREALAVAVLSPLAYILVLVAMQLAPVSLVAPARELSIVMAGLAGWLLLGEAQPAKRLGGAMVVLAGVVLLAAS